MLRSPFFSGSIRVPALDIVALLCQSRHIQPHIRITLPTELLTQRKKYVAVYMTRRHHARQRSLPSKEIHALYTAFPHILDRVDKLQWHVASLHRMGVHPSVQNYMRARVNNAVQRATQPSVDPATIRTLLHEVQSIRGDVAKLQRAGPPVVDPVNVQKLLQEMQRIHQNVATVHADTVKLNKLASLTKASCEITSVTPSAPVPPAPPLPRSAPPAPPLPRSKGPPLMRKAPDVTKLSGYNAVLNELKRKMAVRAMRV